MLFFKKKYFIFLLLCFCFNNIHAQNQYIEKWFSADSEHLPQNSVKNILKDKYGFLWIATENGIVKYDGLNFSIINNKILNTKSSRIFNFYGSTLKDSIYATTGLNEVILINKREAKKVKTESIIIKNKALYESNYFKNTSSLTETKIDNFKITTTDFYLFEFKNNEINIIDSNGSLLQKHSHFFNPKKNYFLLKNSLLTIDNSGAYEIFTPTGKISNKIKLSFYEKLYFNPVNQQVFTYTTNSISIVEFRNGELKKENIYSKSVDFDFSIYSIYYDKQNKHLYLGTTNKGLCIIKKNPFKILDKPNETNNIFYALDKISDSTFITSKGDLFSTNSYIKKLIKSDVEEYTLAIDKEKNIWIKSSNLIFKYLKSENYKKAKTHAFNTAISRIYNDKNNRIWISFLNTETAPYIAKINAYDEEITPTFISKFNDEITYITERENEIILSSNSSVYFLNPDNLNLRTVKTNENEIRSVYVCKSNKIWICTYNNGFSLLEDNKKLYRMPIDKQSFLNSAHNIFEDTNGFFWITTNKGLVQVSKKELLNYKNDNTKPVFYYHYDISDGLSTNEFNGGCEPNYTFFEDGNLILPSLNGLVSFYPKRINPLLPNGNIFISSVEEDNTKTLYTENLTLNRNTNRVIFNIDFPYLGNAKNLDLEAKLIIAGNEKTAKWSQIPANKKLSFTNLPPGDHTLVIKKNNGFNLEPTQKKINFKVPFYFYEKLWFKILLSTFILALIFIAYQIRLNFIKQQNIELEKNIQLRTEDLNLTIDFLNETKQKLKTKIDLQKKLIGTISHDIKSPLKYLTVGLKRLEAISLEIDNNENQKLSSSLKESSINLFNFVTNLINYSKVVLDNTYEFKDFVNIDDVILDIFKLYKNPAIDKNNEFRYENLSKKVVLVNETLTKIIVTNLVDNAIKNTKNGQIKIRVDMKNDKIYFSISDTGSGIDKKTSNIYMNIFKDINSEKFSLQNSGLGLYLIMDLIHYLNGDFSIEKNLPNGTLINIIVDSKISNL